MAKPKEKKDEVIRQSHARSEAFGVQKDQVVSKRILKGKPLTDRLQDKQSLIEVAEPFMNQMRDFLAGSGFVLILTDESGCILRLVGDTETLEETRALDMVTGAYMDEKSIGTNAMGIAIAEDHPIQLSAREHFITAYHRWTCSAAPIHDPNGTLVGTLNLTGKRESVHPHTLGWVVAAVKAVENQLSGYKEHQLLQDSYAYITSIMNTLAFGVFAVGSDGLIQRVNDSACKVLQLEREAVLGQPVGRFMPGWKAVMRLVEGGRKVLDRETQLLVQGKAEVISLNVYPIHDAASRVEGVVFSFREMKRIYHIVNRYTGMNARYNFEDLIGESDGIRRVVDYAKTVANSPSTILINGASGTGKEVIAQAIHNYGVRKDFGFVALNCGAIPESLIESELFGYDPGAFTGARKGGRPGKFELANGGTLFLDEIGEMPLEMQVRLLRALQEGVVTRVGGEKEIAVDVRIIAATNKDLLEEVKKGRFRLDLFYRLSVIPLQLPPLCERKEDIPLLMNYFLNSKAIKLKKEVPEIDHTLYNQMMAYHWPGNIRELENYIEKYVNLEGNLQFDQLLPEPVAGEPLVPAVSETPAVADETIYTIEELEKREIVKALGVLNSNMTKVAQALGVSRNTLYLKIKKYGIRQ